MNVSYKNIVETGNFVLKSGRKSNVYLNVKKLGLDPKQLRIMSHNLAKKIDIKQIDLIAGVPYGAISIATHVSDYTNKPMFLLRKEEKGHGSSDLPKDIHSKNVMLIEDVVTTGTSVMEQIMKLESKGINVKKVVSLFNRNNSPPEFLEKYDYEYLINFSEEDYMSKNCFSLNKKSEQLKDIIEKKQSNICFAADVGSLDSVIKTVKMIGEHITILKLHVDTVNDFTIKKMKVLKQLSTEYNFMIWEDRKFADIGKIMQEQLNGGIFQISSWADIVSVHALSGQDCVDVFNNTDIGVLLISEMSTNENLITDEYTQKVIEMAHLNKNVMGVVCQNNMDIGNLLKVVPGISTTQVEGINEKGQVYTSMSVKKFADIVVLGRSIYNLSPETMSKKVDKLKKEFYKLYTENKKNTIIW